MNGHAKEKEISLLGGKTKINMTLCGSVVTKTGFSFGTKKGSCLLEHPKDWTIVLTHRRRKDAEDARLWKGGANVDCCLHP